ncbi:MAG: hypothetical protein AAF197_05165 [Pseudomonadota bacterium]
MEEALKDVAVDSATLPDYIERGFVDKETGVRTDEFDPNGTEEIFALEPLRPELLVANMLNEQLLSDADPDWDQTTLDPLSTQDPSFDPFIEDSETSLDGSLPESDQNQSVEKIIESDEETEGLF